jgi:ketosteroid isomerase-like protein
MASLRSQYEQTVRRFLELLEKKDLDVWIELWAGLVPPQMVGRRTVLEYWKDVSGTIESLSFAISKIYVDEVERTAVVRLESHHVLADGKGRYDKTYLCLFTFDHRGLIAEYHEYLQPSTTGVTYGLIDVRR